jgi:hypothetical protein
VRRAVQSRSSRCGKAPGCRSRFRYRPDSWYAQFPSIDAHNMVDIVLGFFLEGRRLSHNSADLLSSHRQRSLYISSQRVFRRVVRRAQVRHAPSVSVRERPSCAVGERHEVGMTMANGHRRPGIHCPTFRQRCKPTEALEAADSAAHGWRNDEMLLRQLGAMLTAAALLTCCGRSVARDLRGSSQRPGTQLPASAQGTPARKERTQRIHHAGPRRIRNAAAARRSQKHAGQLGIKTLYVTGQAEIKKIESAPKHANYDDAKRIHTRNFPSLTLKNWQEVKTAECGGSSAAGDVEWTSTKHLGSARTGTQERPRSGEMSTAQVVRGRRTPSSSARN